MGRGARVEEWLAKLGSSFLSPSSAERSLLDWAEGEGFHHRPGELSASCFGPFLLPPRACFRFTFSLRLVSSSSR